jgi:hypothetical protein
MQNLAHQRDLKVTYANGFHVNYAVTALARVNVDHNVYCSDYDNFFKATQPLIDEEALNPAEFNLVRGVFLTNSINLLTFKKNQRYMGHVAGSDYQCLDFALTNLSKDIRKYIATNLGSLDMTLQSFVAAKMRTSAGEAFDEHDFESHPGVYA